MGDHYAVLGVPRNATLDEIRHAYRARARRLHPDAGRGGDAVAAFREVHDAYVTLSDAAARLRYDRTLPPEPEVRPAPRHGAELVPVARPRPQAAAGTLWRRARALEAYVPQALAQPLLVDVVAW